MKLFFRRMGQGEPLIILHGLYGCSDNWLTVGRSLSERYEVFIPDMRNHGKSPHHPEHTYPAMCADVLELMDDNRIDRCTLIGHSMGGKVAFHVAGKAPHRLNKMIIDDIAPVNYSSLSDFSPQAIEHLNIVHTLLETDMEQYSRLQDIEQFWTGGIPDATVRRFLLKNLQRNDENRYTWKLNVKVIAKHLPHLLNGMDEFEKDATKNTIALPVLFLKGEQSPYIQPGMFPLIRNLMPCSEIITIPGAGHWLHVEQTRLFLEKVSAFLEQAG